VSKLIPRLNLVIERISRKGESNALMLMLAMFASSFKMQDVLAWTNCVAIICPAIPYKFVLSGAPGWT
tara:strand:+ start:2080 stop:2283 length:204 start_codon:yes stop_codon:yes gene_type:complete